MVLVRDPAGRGNTAESAQKGIRERAPIGPGMGRDRPYFARCSPLSEVRFVPHRVPPVHAKIPDAEPGGPGKRHGHHRQGVLLPGMRLHLAKGCQTAMASKTWGTELFHRGCATKQSGFQAARAKIAGGHELLPARSRALAERFPERGALT